MYKRQVRESASRERLQQAALIATNSWQDSPITSFISIGEVFSEEEANLVIYEDNFPEPFILGHAQSVMVNINGFIATGKIGISTDTLAGGDLPLWAVMVHEFGHLLGFDGHAPVGSDSVMVAQFDPASFRVFPSPSDINTVKEVHCISF